jgi:hypothetical protein
MREAHFAMGHHRRSPSRWKTIIIYSKDGLNRFELDELGKLIEKRKQRRRKTQALMTFAQAKPKFPLLEPVHPILLPRELVTAFEK